MDWNGKGSPKSNHYAISKADRAKDRIILWPRARWRIGHPQAGYTLRGSQVWGLLVQDAQPLDMSGSFTGH